MAGKEYTTAPILVNSDGHPIPQYLDITDTTDSPQGTFKPLTQLQAEHPDVQNVQLTGRNVEREIIFERSIRNTSAFIHVKDVPDGAIGLIAVCAVFGVTGEFESGQGLRLETGL